jgi:flagellar export protein FliJ
VAVKPEYRLQTLLKIRERAKEAAEQYLAECLRALRVEQERLREMEEELERMIAKREAKTREYSEKAMRGEMDAAAVTGANVYIERLKELEENQKNAIEGQKSVVAQKEEDVRGARQDLAKATQELKALEKHREKWEKEIKKQEEARQEQFLDEIVQSMFNKPSGG